VTQLHELPRIPRLPYAARGSRGDLHLSMTLLPAHKQCPVRKRASPS
jgi:hypothetical protein